VECPLLFFGAASEVVRVAAEERSIRFTVAPDIEGLLALHSSLDAAGLGSLADKCLSRAETESFISVPAVTETQRIQPFCDNVQPSNEGEQNPKPIHFKHGILPVTLQCFL